MGPFGIKDIYSESQKEEITLSHCTDGGAGAEHSGFVSFGLGLQHAGCPGPPTRWAVGDSLCGGRQGCPQPSMAAVLLDPDEWLFQVFQHRGPLRVLEG